MEYLISFILVVLSALFSGLTLGLMTLDPIALNRRAKYGDKDSALIYPIRKKGNLLLTTLLLGNVTVNTTLSIYLGDLASGLVAGLVATGLIVIFGEILPQALISRHALWFGARTIWFTKIAIFLGYPIAYPISKILDYFLGSQIPTTYTHSELMDIISEQEDSEHSSIDADEERIAHGALQFSHRTVKEVMTRAKDVIMFADNEILDDKFFQIINDHGFSRFPIYQKSRDNIIGILYAKDLLVEEEDITIKDTREAFDRNFLSVKEEELLDTVLGKILKKRQHLACVFNKNGKFSGVISLEDIIEEIIQQEIEDEADEA